MEQEEYTREEIDWSYVEFVDNQDVLDLIEKVISDFILLVYGQKSKQILEDNHLHLYTETRRHNCSSWRSLVSECIVSVCGSETQ